jgi:hypothetical protein
VVGDGEGEVEVGEPVAAAHGERAHRGSGDYALVFLREPQHAVTDGIPLFDREHGPRF